MRVVKKIVPSLEFIRQAKRFAKKYKSFVEDLKRFQEVLMKEPYIGTDLGGGKRKIRLGVVSKSKGKRGGMRVITFNVVETGEELTIYLVTIYDKSEYSSVSDRYVNQIIKELE